MSGQNYIGSKISLISLSDIRYVGILHNINSAESTVALQNVQSFGTEGRKTNLSEEIPTSDNIFDYVVFRGSDIKDLQVFEAPPSYKPAVSAVEPTVIQDTNSNMMQPSSNGNNSYYNTNSSSINQQYYAPPALPVTSTYCNYWQNNTTSYIQPQQAQQQYQFQPQQQQMRMPVPENYKKSTTSELEREKTSFVIAQDTSIAIEERKVPTSVISQEKQEVHVTAKESPTTVKKDQTVKDKEKKKKEKEVDDEENIVDSLAKQVSDLDIKAPELSKVTQERIFKQQQQQQQQQQTLQKSTTSASSSNAIRNGNHSNNRNNSRSSAASGNTGNGHRDSTNNHQTRGGGSDRHRRRSSATRDLVVPRSDFDFASANAKFDKTEITLAAAANADENNSETVLIPEPEQFYNKEKSFFDDISCESKEYKKGILGGGKYHEERKLNLETFGQANPNGGGSGNNAKGGNHRHRGGRGGRGGRGFHRGGSGGGKSNNKQLGPNKNQNGSNIESIA